MGWVDRAWGRVILYCASSISISISGIAAYWAFAKGYSVTHYAYSSPIGSGNAVLYGHDDIEGSVFSSIKDLKPGDEVDVVDASGSITAYHVTGKPAIVPPSAVQILQPTNDVRLTLFTCWPNWVDTQRVVVTAMPATA